MGYKVLLADDSITVQKIVKLSLTEEGIEVIAFGNGEQAVQQIEAIQPDLIMADVFMPGKDGYEVCEYVKAHPQFKNIPVILLVHAFEPFDPERAKKVCADHQLTKPFQSIRTLVTTVQELLARPQTPVEVPPSIVESVSAESVAPVGQVIEQPMPSMADISSGLMAPPVPAMSYAMEPELPTSLSVSGDFSGADLLPPLDLPESNIASWSSPTVAPTVASMTTAAPENAVEDDVLDLSDHAPLTMPSIQPATAMASMNSPASTKNSDDLLLSVMHSEPEVNLPEGTTLMESSAMQGLSLDVGLGTLMPQATSETASDPETFAEERSDVMPSVMPIVSEPIKFSEGATQIFESAIPESVIEDIVNRVIQKLSTTAIQDIAWEVVPEMAELLIRKQIAQQKQLAH
jgi:CheY-like chemotaxis protein